MAHGGPSAREGGQPGPGPALEAAAAPRPAGRRHVGAGQPPRPGTPGRRSANERAARGAAAQWEPALLARAEPGGGEGLRGPAASGEVRVGSRHRGAPAATGADLGLRGPAAGTDRRGEVRGVRHGCCGGDSPLVPQELEVSVGPGVQRAVSGRARLARHQPLGEEPGREKYL